ncbi:MAG: DNA ligase (NAD+) [Chloroflexi bacterium]|jgi:DNA ligase (NAD+)|nr:MAG: DNA ligase (NAD+) [Chloroflexota bacterium]
MIQRKEENILVKISIKIQKQIEELVKQVNEYDYYYYSLDKPKISDQEYDEIFNQLNNLEIKHPQFIDKNSPTQRVSGTALEAFKHITHNNKMLSLSNVFNNNEIIDWCKKNMEEVSSSEILEIVCEPKIDGLAVNLTYNNGEFIQAATRGDGYIGEDITANIRTIRSLPLKIDYKKKISIRGEIYIKKTEFNIINNQRKKDGFDIYMNPRNLAAGTMRQLNPAIVSERKLQLFTYQLINEEDNSQFNNTHHENMMSLNELGFPVNSLIKKVKGEKKVIEYCKNIENIRDSLDYEIDGVVIKFNNLKIQNMLGSRSRSPKWATAYKFKAEQKYTELTAIAITVGRTGTLTPVATLKPIVINGVTVKHATLHNEKYIKINNIDIGDTVAVERSGDVIPKIIGLKKGKRDKRTTFLMPKKCPFCLSFIKKNISTSEAQCININCKERLKKNIIYFVSKECMNIRGLGTQIIEKLIRENIIRNISDLFYLYLQKDKIIFLEKMGEKSVSNLIDEINKSKKLPLNKILTALGIHNVGSEIALLLAEKYTNIDNLTNAKLEELKNIEGIGPIVSNSIFEFFNSAETQELLNKLKSAGLNMHQNMKINSVEQKKTYLYNQNVAITGTMVNWTRSELFELLIKLGAKINKTITKKTTILVVGTDPGKKLTLAENNNIKKLYEKELLDLIK